MNYIRTYEDFDFSQTIPTTSKNVLTNYYSCDECNALWKEFNKSVEKCKFCNCSEIEDLSEDEYYYLQKSRLDGSEIEDIESETRLRALALTNSLNEIETFVESIELHFSIASCTLFSPK